VPDGGIADEIRLRSRARQNESAFKRQIRLGEDFVSIRRETRGNGEGMSPQSVLCLHGVRILLAIPGIFQPNFLRKDKGVGFTLV
jgi:hypothetical protein